MELIEPNTYRANDKLYTVNLNPGVDVYGEKLTKKEGQELRGWDPNRSKPAAAVLNGVKLDFRQDMDILYLGAASGTTVSHFSDIMTEGFIFAVEYSATVGRDLISLAEERENIAPIIDDARKPESYENLVPGKVDLVYQDISQRDQADILVKNCRKFLKEDGVAMIAVKAQSISSTEDPEKIFGQFKDDVDNYFEILEETRLEPYEKDHLFLKMRVK